MKLEKGSGSQVGKLTCATYENMHYGEFLWVTGFDLDVVNMDTK